MNLSAAQLAVRSLYKAGAKKALIMKDQQIIGYALLSDLLANLADNASAKEEIDIHYSSREQDFNTLFQETQQKKIPVLKTSGEFVASWDQERFQEQFYSVNNKSLQQKSYPYTNKENEPHYNTSKSQPVDHSIREETNRDSWALLTLETLPIPMIAVTLNGKEIFHNEDWDLLAKDSQPLLSRENIISLIKEKLGEVVMNPTFNENQPIRVSNYLPNQTICFRVIQEKIPGGLLPIGYLVWAEATRNQPELDTPSGQQVSLEQFTSKLRKEERDLLLNALQQSGGNHSEAARTLGIPRQTFTYRLRKLEGKSG